MSTTDSGAEPDRSNPENTAQTLVLSHDYCFLLKKIDKASFTIFLNKKHGPI